MAQLRGQPPKGNQPPKKDDKAPPAQAAPKSLLDGIKHTDVLSNEDPVKDFQRFLKQEGVAMDGMKLGMKYSESETPPTKWFDGMITTLRGSLMKIGTAKGATGTD